MLLVHFDLLNLLWFWLTVLDWTAGIPGKISVNKLSVDPIPNSLKRKHHRNCMAQSKENYWWDLGSERVKLSEVLFWITQYLTNCTPTPPSQSSPSPISTLICYQLIVDRSTVVQLFDSFLYDVLSLFSLLFWYLLLLLNFFLRSLVSHHVRFLCLAWFKGSHLESPLLIVLALFYHSVPQRAEESSVPPCCHVSPHCTTAIIAV